jgi:hypothetical protein
MKPRKIFEAHVNCVKKYSFQKWMWQHIRQSKNKGGKTPNHLEVRKSQKQMLTAEAQAGPMIARSSSGEEIKENKSSLELHTFAGTEPRKHSAGPQGYSGRCS